MAVKEYPQERWSLADLFPAADSPEVEARRDELEGLLKSFEGERDSLALDIPEKRLVEILDAYDLAVRLLSRLYRFGYLRFAEDTQDQAAQTFLAQMRQLAAEFENRTLFFKLWWKELDDEPAERLMAASGDYRYWLEALRLERPYTLSEAEEKVVNLKDVNGAQALVTLYDSFTNRFTYNLEVDGEVKELNRDELMNYVWHHDADLRAAAYQEFLRVFDREAPVLGQIYQYRARDWRSEQVDLRGFAAPISSRNLSNDIPDDVVDTLLDVCRANASLFQRFFRLKARWLGVDRLRRYDIYAPVVSTQKVFSYAEAVEMVLGSFHRFDPKVAKLAQRVFDERHLDSEVRNGKITGAFCLTVSPDLTPWVLMSYNGKPRDVATLAHELGHAIHSMLAEDHSTLTQHATLPLAETASTFGEMLLVDQLLEISPDPEVQRDVLFRQMDEAYATIGRQAHFALFERQAHDLIHEGASVDDLSNAYFEILQEQFGDSLDLSEDFRVEWTSIPHFLHAPFYVYAYAFGQLLVLALYQQYREEGDAFKPRYIELLSTGGSDSPMRILERAGIDVRSAAFWQGGFDVLKVSLEQLEAL